MLRFIVRVFLLASILVTSNSVALGRKKRVYSIQMFSIVRALSRQEIIKTVPKKLHAKLHLHKATNGVIVALYSQALNYKSISKALRKVRKAGYKKAYIITTTRWYMPQKEKNTKNKTLKLSKYIISQMIVKANKAYKNANEQKAMMYYEMLLSAGVKSEKIKNNLCYLYGKNGAWSEAKNIIDKETYHSKLIYAYANGAVKTSQKSFYNDMREYIMLDKSGHLALLAGYYFEKNDDRKKAFKFYKMAYEKNRNDVYNIYAYARFLDIIGKKSDAIKLYMNVYKRTNNESPLHKALHIRLY